jgi:hypothetical protein
MIPPYFVARRYRQFTIFIGIHLNTGTLWPPHYIAILLDYGKLAILMGGALA